MPLLATMPAGRWAMPLEGEKVAEWACSTANCAVDWKEARTAEEMVSRPAGAMATKRVVARAVRSVGSREESAAGLSAVRRVGAKDMSPDCRTAAQKAACSASCSEWTPAAHSGSCSASWLVT